MIIRSREELRSQTREIVEKHFGRFVRRAAKGEIRKFLLYRMHISQIYQTVYN